MSEVFVVRNQLGHYWGKGKKWVDGRVPKAVLGAKHEDEAINTLFELGSKDFELRGEVLPVALNDRNEPVVEASENLIEDEVEPTDGAAGADEIPQQSESAEDVSVSDENSPAEGAAATT